MLQLPLPFVVTVDIGERHNLPAAQYQQTFVDLGLAAGGHPQEPRHQTCTDDGRLFALHQGNHFLGVLLQQMLPEETLRERPVLGELPPGLEHGVDPVDSAGRVLVFDAVAGLGIVLDDLSSTASALDIQLEEDGAAVPGDAQAVVRDEARDGFRREEGAEEGDEGGVVVGPDGTADDVGEDEAEILRCAQNDKARCPDGPGIKGMGKVITSAPQGAEMPMERLYSGKRLEQRSMYKGR